MNFFTKFIKSISDVKSYSVFRKETPGKAIAYLLLITLILGTVRLIKPIIGFNKGINEAARFVKEESRSFTFSDGKLQVEGDMPIIFDDESEVIIIDTTGNTTEADLDKYDNAMLITQDALYQKQNGIQSRKTDLSAIKGFTLTKEQVENFIPKLKYISIGIIIFGLIGFFIGKLITALIVALLGLIVKSIQKSDVTFGELYRLSIYALTLPIVISVIVKLSGLTIPFFYTLYCLGAAAYLWFALRAMKEDRDNSEYIEPLY